MVNATPARLREDAADLFRHSGLPESFAFFDSLTPVNQRLFAVELWDALSRVSISETEQALAEFVEIVEAWEATAELDSAPEVQEVLSRKKRYREVPR